MPTDLVLSGLALSGPEGSKVNFFRKLIKLAKKTRRLLRQRGIKKTYF